MKLPDATENVNANHCHDTVENTGESPERVATTPVTPTTPIAWCRYDWCGSAVADCGHRQNSGYSKHARRAVGDGRMVFRKSAA